MMNLTFRLAAGMLFAATLAHASALPVRRIGIDIGPVDQQMFQRDSDGHGAFQISGEASGPESTSLEYRLLRRTQVVAGFDWNSIEVKDDGRWSTDVRGIPTGGPFRLEIRLRDSSGAVLDDHDIDGLLVGDLWVLAGQSNMDGTGDLSEAEEPHEMVHCFNLADQWLIAEDPLHWCYESIYPVYLTSYVTPTQRKPIDYEARGQWPTWNRPSNQGAGLGISFGKTIHEKTGVPIGLILCSLGGSSMQQWSPDLRDQGDKALYSAMLMRIDKVGGTIKGVLWYQGESDTNSGSSRVYEERLMKLIQSIRADQGNDEMPFYIVQLARMVGGDETKPEEINSVRAAQFAVGGNVPHTETVAALDLGMSSGSHLDTDGYKRIGRRLAKAALANTYDVESMQPGPRFRSATVEGSPQRPTIRVTFDHVNKRLSPDQRVAGFTIRSADGSQIVNNYLNASVIADSPNEVRIDSDLPIPAGAVLWYGYGWNPYCNLVDALDIAAPAFGPVPLEK